MQLQAATQRLDALEEKARRVTGGTTPGLARRALAEAGRFLPKLFAFFTDFRILSSHLLRARAT